MIVCLHHDLIEILSVKSLFIPFYKIINIKPKRVQFHENLVLTQVLSDWWQPARAVSEKPTHFCEMVVDRANYIMFFNELGVNGAGIP